MAEIELEIAVTMRECYERVVAKVLAEQLGELWIDFDSRRADSARMRGPDRRNHAYPVDAHRY